MMEILVFGSVARNSFRTTIKRSVDRLSFICAALDSLLE